MAKITVTFTITEFCLHTGLSEEELNEIVGLGMIEPRQPHRENWLFDDSAVTIVHRAVRLRKEPGAGLAGHRCGLNSAGRERAPDAAKIKFCSSGWRAF